MFRKLWLGDWSILAYCAFLTVLCVARLGEAGWIWVVPHAAIAGIVLLLVRSDRPGAIGFLRAWDALLLVPILFFMNAQLVHRINPHDVDEALIRIEGVIGGLTVLKWMARIETPWLTDFFKLSWMSYYLFPLVAGIPLYRRGREAYRPLKDALVLGWMFTYGCYIVWPAKGPGYFQRELDVPQPKWEQTATATVAKKLIDRLEAPDPRHTFPSGHVMIAAIVAYFLIADRLGMWAWLGVPLAASIVAATVYLRYHYCFDVVCGLATAAGCVLIARRGKPTIAPP